MNPIARILPLVSSSLVLIIALFLIGCGAGSSDSESTEEAFYPIDYCIVSGNDFDEEGSKMIPFTYIHEGITIKFCCKPCLPKFKENPEKYLVILEEELESLKNVSSGEG